MTASYVPTRNSEAEMGSLTATTGNAPANFITVTRQKIAVMLIGVGLVATVAWVAVLGWAVGLLLRLW